MIKPELLDVVELLIDLSETELQAGALGTIVETYNDRAYEVEFANSEGETLALQVLAPEQLYCRLAKYDQGLGAFSQPHYRDDSKTP